MPHACTCQAFRLLPACVRGCRHGGPSASRFVRDRLFKNLLAHEQFARNLGKAVEDAYVVRPGGGAGVC